MLKLMFKRYVLFKCSPEGRRLPDRPWGEGGDEKEWRLLPRGGGICGPTGRGGLMGEEPDTPDSSLSDWRPSHLLMKNGRRVH